MISAIVTAVTSAMTAFVTPLGTALVDAFTALFWVEPTGSATTGSLTNLAQGLLAIVGMSLVIGCVIKVYHIFAGRIRRRV